MYQTDDKFITLRVKILITAIAECGLVTLLYLHD